MKYSIYILTFAAVLLSACSADEVLQSGTDDAVILRPSVCSSVLKTNSSGTYDYGTSFLDGDKISLTNGKQTAVYTLSGGEWTTTDTPVTWHKTSEEFYVFYPADGTNTYEIGYVKQDQSTLENLRASDFMRRICCRNITDDRVLELELRHKVARVIFKIGSFNNQWQGKNPRVDYVHVYGFLSDTAPNLSEITPYDNNGEYVAFLMPSFQDSDQNFVALDVVTDDNPTATRVMVKGVPRLKECQSYTFTITVGKNEATIESVTVEDWTTGAAIPGGEATLKNAYEITGNTITLSVGGVLAENSSLLTQAIGTGNSLVVKGTINDDDIAAINTCIKNCSDNVNLDLSGTTITEIPANAFDNNFNLAEVRLPKTLITIRDNAFYQCDAASFPNFDEVAPSLEIIGKNVFTSTQLQGNITLSNLKSVGFNVFSDIEISSITFPPAITEVPVGLLNCVRGCSSVVFEGSLTNIGLYAFRYANIATIDLTACDAVPTCNPKAFQDMLTTTKIIVKSSLLNDFQTAEVWKDLASQLVGK